MHSAAVRVAAIVVAAALAGVVPWLEAPHAEATHRCQCARGGGHHDCDCPLCAAEAARARAAAAERETAPPCHLARARKIEAEERESSARRAASAPVLASTCGDGDHRFDPPPTVPTFTLPSAPAVALLVEVPLPIAQLAADLGDPLEPETPPPRLA